MRRELVVAAALGIGGLAACGDDDAADICTAVTDWETAVTDATNAFPTGSPDADDAAARKELYLDAFEEIGDLTDELADDVAAASAGAELVSAVDFAVQLIAEERAEAEALGLEAFQFRAVRGGSLITASERSRATVMTAWRAQCSPGQANGS